MATFSNATEICKGLIAVRVVDGIVQNKYSNDPCKLAAWASASHVEKPPKKTPPTP